MRYLYDFAVITLSMLIRMVRFPKTLGGEFKLVIYLRDYFYDLI